MPEVITYQSFAGETVNLTQDQIRKLDSQLRWPRDRHGQEICSVSHGLHEGCPTYTDEEITEMFTSSKEN